LNIVHHCILGDMQSLSFPSFGSSDRDINSALNVVIAYEDLETGKRAMKTYEYMVQQLGDQCLFANQMWKFDVLAVPKLKEIAAKDAAAAEIIIVAAHEGRDLPAEVKSWIEMWLGYKTEASALVGLFDGENESTPARNYLAEVARRAKIEFFSQPGIWPGAPHTRSTTTLAHPLDEKTFAFLANATQEAPSFTHWGINE
jgi:hypothetical protein